MRRIAPITTSLLLLASAVLTVAGASQRWAAACPIGGDWNSEECVTQQNHEYDALLPAEPWMGDHTAALLIGLGYVLLGCALLLLPAAFAMGARPWQSAAVLISAAGLLAMGISAAQSGRQGRVIETSGLILFLAAVVLPAALFLLMWRPFADSPPLGSRRAAVVWLLVLATPLLHYLVVVRLLILYTSHDTAPWTEAAIVPLLLASAVLLKPWRAPAPHRSFSNQQRAHSLSL
jgi:hypothetical protein